MKHIECLNELSLSSIEYDTTSLLTFDEVIERYFTT